MQSESRVPPMSLGTIDSPIVLDDDQVIGSSRNSRENGIAREGNIQPSIGRFPTEADRYRGR